MCLSRRCRMIKAHVIIVHEIVSRASREDLMLFYNLPAFAEKDTNAFLSALARANGLIKKVCLFSAFTCRSADDTM